MSHEHPSHDEIIRDALLNLMHNLSEDCWCASWMKGLEFTLWQAMMNGSANLGFGVRDSDLTRLKSLHELAGGWWLWPEGEESERFVNTAEWLKFYAAHCANTKT